MRLGISIIRCEMGLECCNLSAVALQVAPGHALSATICEKGRYEYSGLWSLVRVICAGGPSTRPMVNALLCASAPCLELGKGQSGCEGKMNCSALSSASRTLIGEAG
jgi:hypothetical protein